MRTASAPKGLKTTLATILPLSLVAGIMLGGFGSMIYPPVDAWAASLVCRGNVEVQSDHYTTPSGGSGVQRQIDCVTGAGREARRDITMMTIGVAILGYGALAFALLQIFAARAIRRRAEARLAITDFGGGIRAQGVSSPAELQAILAQVSEALSHGQAEVNVRNVTIDVAGGGDAGGRLVGLKQLRDGGLISDADYEAKKTEILAGL